MWEGDRDAISRRERNDALGAVWCVGCSYWFFVLVTARREHVGYLFPSVMAISLATAHGISFVASRLERSDVTHLERRIRYLLFRKI